MSGRHDRNIKFQELRKVLLEFGFKERIRGSHHIYFREDIPKIINLQPLSDGRAKPYQVKQVRELFTKYNFILKRRKVND